MKTIIEHIGDVVSKAFEECGYDASYAKITISNRPDLCEYQCNGAMAAAKAYKKAPFMIADEVVEKLSGSSMFEKVESVKPGFININISAGYIADFVNGMSEKEKFGYEPQVTNKTVIVDYGGANAAKPLHVGHLRSAVIGESVKRIQKYAGNNVIGDVHLGDWGLQMGLIIEELRDRKPELPYFDENYTGEYPAEPPFTISELEEIYPTASAKSKDDEAFLARAHEATLKLQSGDKACTAIWHHIMNVSKADLKKNYDNLNVHFDLWKGESDAQPYIPDMIQSMIDSGLAYESQGATVVDIQEDTDTKELPPCIIRKSDGAALYATSDLATLVEREKLYHPDSYIYLADKRQELHFTQVFRVAKKAGIVKSDADMTFLGFGTMNGNDGKPFKTRSGGVMRLENLIADIQDAVYGKITENRTMDQAEARDTARIVGLAALKYGDLSNQASKDYVFDVERFTSFEGNTGPYILYTIVRIKSILAKYAAEGGKTDNLKLLPPVSASEKNLELALVKYLDVMEAAYMDKAPHKICQYIYEISNVFNGFYHDTKILAEQDKERKERKKIGEICIRYGVIVVSDEIHSDFTWGENKHLMFASLSDDFANISITCTAPSKTFNLAGLQVSNIFIPNETLRFKFKKAVDAAGYSQVNVMGLEACQAAYEYGEEWLTQLKEYLKGNIAFVREFIQTRLPKLTMIEPEGTYLLWIDFRALGLTEVQRQDLIENKANLWLDSGAMFGPDGEGFERFNVACPRSVLKQAFEQLEKAVNSL